MNTGVNWNERQQVIGIMAAAGLIIFGLWFFLLTPLNHRRHQLEQDIQGISAQLAQQNYLLGEESLRRKKNEEDRRYDALCAQWSQIVARVSMSPAGSNDLDLSVGHIDYKVALFNVQDRLRQRSSALKIKLPRNLGLDDSVDSNEDARKLMLQIRAVEDVAELLLNVKIGEIQYIEPLSSVPHSLGDGKPIYMEELPIKVRFFGTTSNLYTLFQAAIEPKHTFAFRNLRVEKASLNQPELLDVTAVISALVLTPDSISAVRVEPRAAAPAVPMGY